MLVIDDSRQFDEEIKNAEKAMDELNIAEGSECNKPDEKGDTLSSLK